jgi:hypothetical protein
MQGPSLLNPSSGGNMVQDVKMLYFMRTFFLLILMGVIITEILERIIYYFFLGTLTPEKE